MSFTNKKLQTFIEDDILKSENIYSILDRSKTQSEKGFVYERLWDLVIKFGFCPMFSNNSHNHQIGNMNNGKQM